MTQNTLLYKQTRKDTECECTEKYSFLRISIQKEAMEI